MSPPSTHCWIRDWSALGRAVRVDAGAVARALPKRQLPDPRGLFGRWVGRNFGQLKRWCLRLLSRKRNRASQRAQRRKKQRRVTPLPTRRLKLTSQKLKRLLSALLLRNSPTRIRNRQMKRLVSPTKPLILKRLQATPPMKEIEIRIGGITQRGNARAETQRSRPDTRRVKIALLEFIGSGKIPGPFCVVDGSS